VDVFEGCPDPGGRARRLTFHGVAFDAGPTVITAPWLFDELFTLFGERRSDFVEFLPCDPWYRLSYWDGTTLDLVPSVERQEKEIANLSPVDASAYRRFFDHSQKLYEVGYEQLGAADFSDFKSMLRMLPKLFRLGGFTTLWRHTGRFFSDPRVRQAFSLQPLLVGGNPLDTTSIYGLIHAMERKGGIWCAKGGTGALVSQLVQLASRHGVRFHYNRAVENVGVTSDGRVDGVVSRVGGERLTTPCDLVVWGGDPRHLYAALGAPWLSPIERIRAKTAKSSMGLYVLYFKTKRAYEQLAHHTIVLSKRWHGLLQDIFKGQNLPSDPSLYLHRPAATDPTMKLADGDLFYVLAPVPHLGSFNNWEECEPRFKEIVLSTLEERVLPGLSTELAWSEAVDPRYFRDTLMSPLGAGFSIAPLLSQSGWFRFHNRMDRVANLYLCGAGVHPGGGLPGVVTSAKVVEQIVRRDFPSMSSSCLSDARVAVGAS
jgi:phytoene desaturase